VHDVVVLYVHDEPAGQDVHDVADVVAYLPRAHLKLALRFVYGHIFPALQLFTSEVDSAPGKEYCPVLTAVPLEVVEVQ